VTTLAHAFHPRRDPSGATRTGDRREQRGDRRRRTWPPDRWSVSRTMPPEAAAATTCAPTSPARRRRQRVSCPDRTWSRRSAAGLQRGSSWRVCRSEQRSRPEQRRLRHALKHQEHPTLLGVRRSARAEYAGWKNRPISHLQCLRSHVARTHRRRRGETKGGRPKAASSARSEIDRRSNLGLRPLSRRRVTGNASVHAPWLGLRVTSKVQSTR
jgi:hypothetical protein